MIWDKVIIGIPEDENKASEELVEFLKIISEPCRFKIIQHLYYNSELSVKDITLLLNNCQPAISQHLKVLKLSNIVKQNKNGRKIYYSMDLKGIEKKYGKGIDYLRRYFLNEINLLEEK